MKDQIKPKTKNKVRENFSPVCFQNDTDIQEEYLSPQQKKGELPNKTSEKTKKKKD